MTEATTGKEVAVSERNKPLPPMANWVKPKGLTEAKEFAKMMASSGIVPKDMINKPEAVLVAMAMGEELGLPLMMAIQNIMVVNGRPTVWGDALKALIVNARTEVCDPTGVIVGMRKVCELFDEDDPATSLKQGFGRCRVKRFGSPEKEYTFSIEDAKRAGLWTKAGPWIQYPGRMLQMRARSWVCRDEFPDILKGLQVREEIEDVAGNGYTETPMPRATSPAVEAARTAQDARAEAPKPEDKANQQVAGAETQVAGDAQEPVYISDQERKELFNLLVPAKKSMASLTKYLAEQFGVTSSAQIEVQMLEEVRAWIRS